MSFCDVARFVSYHALIGLAKSTGVRLPQNFAKRNRNPQCIKLTKDHLKIDRIVSFWCNLRINKLKELNMHDDDIKRIVREDCVFINALNSALADIGKTQEDAWLFFDADVHSTDYFELKICNKGQKHPKRTHAIYIEFKQH